MQGVGTAGRRHVFGRLGPIGSGAAVLTVAALALSACTSSNGDSGSQPPAGQVSSPPVADGSSPVASASASPSNEPAVITTSVTRRVISPAKPVTVDIAHGRLTAVTMVNPAGKKVSGDIAADGSSWHNTEVLGYSKTYTITAEGVNDAGAPVRKTTRVQTLTPGNMTMPYIDDIYGSGIEDRGTYGVGMVVRVHFDELVDRAKAERALQVTTTPSVTGGWYWQDDANVYWRPRHYFQPGTQVTVAAKVYGKNVGDGLYGQADQSVSFKIGAKHISVANAKTHQVKVFVNDKLARTMPTSMGMGGSTTGKNGQPIYFWTMPGVYTVINHENPAIMSSDSYGLPASSPYGYKAEKVPYATKISVDGIYLHELDSTVGVQGSQNVSHGCLNLNQENAKYFYNLSNVGDVVRVIHSGGPPITFDQGGQWSVPWKEWLAHSAL